MRVWLDPDRLQSLGLTAQRRHARCRGRTSRSRPACSISRRSPNQLAFQVAVRTLGPADRSRRVRQHRRQADADCGGARSRTWRASNWPRRTIRRTPISTAIPRSRSRCSSGRARTRSRPRKAIRATMAQLSKRFPARHQVRHHLRPDPVHPAVGRRGDRDDLRGDHPRRAGGRPVPADLARGHHPDRGDPGLADRHLLLDGAVRVHAQQSVAVRAGAGDRHRGRRRDRRGGERRAQYRGAACRRATPRSSSMDEVGAALVAIALVLCAVFVPVGLHHRHFRPVLPAVRADHRGRDRDFADRVADAVAGACARCCSSRTSDAAARRWWERPIHGFFRLLQ